MIIPVNNYDFRRKRGGGWGTRKREKNGGGGGGGAGEEKGKGMSALKKPSNLNPHPRRLTVNTATNP